MRGKHLRMQLKKTPPKPVLGVTAARARPTTAGAFWLAAVITIPAGIALLLIEGMIRLVF